MIAHPFTRIPEGEIRRFAVPIASLSAVLLVVIVELVQRGPGWLPFADLVLAFTTSGAGEVLSTWTLEDRIRIAFINGLDYLFGPLYANLLALGCVWAARLRPGGGSRAGSVSAWIAWAVLLLDIPENVAYLNLTSGNTGQPWPVVSGACVLARTALVIALLTFMAGCWLQRRERPTRLAG